MTDGGYDMIRHEDGSLEIFYDTVDGSVIRLFIGPVGEEQGTAGRHSGPNPTRCAYGHRRHHVRARPEGGR